MAEADPNQLTADQERQILEYRQKAKGLPEEAVEEVIEKMRNIFKSSNVQAKPTEGAFQYGFDPNEAQRDADYFRQMSEQAQGREGVILDYAKANQDRGNALDARNHQMTVAGMMLRRAQGQTPSIAQAMADRQMGQAAAEQSSAAAGARGPAALALAQQGAAANTANMQSQISGQAQINAMQERERAEQAAMGAYTGMRGQDYQGQGLSAQEAQAQGQLQAQQRALNDQRSLGMLNNEISVKNAAMGSKMAAEGQRVGLVQQGNAMYQQQKAQERADRNQMIGAGMQAAGTIMTMGTGVPPSDERTKVPLAPSTWGTGQGTSNGGPYEAARQALLDNDAREQGLRGGPMAVGGVDVLKQMDEEELGLIRAKERNKVALTPREQQLRESLENREKMYRKPSAEAFAGAKPPTTDGAEPKKDEKKKASPFETIGSGLSNIGAALMRSGMEMKTPVSMPSGMEMKQPVSYSDERAKDPLPLYEPEGRKLQVGADGKGFLASDAPASNAGASLSGPMKRFSLAQHISQKMSAPKKAEPKKLSDAELKRIGEQMLASTHSQKAASLAAGPSVKESPMAASNRSLAAQPYAYKPEFTPPEQAPGEVNVGPMANRMAADPVAATAVRKDPRTGMLGIDIPKYTKVLGGGLAAAQHQIDEQERKLGLLARRLRGRK